MKPTCIVYSDTQLHLFLNPSLTSEPDSLPHSVKVVEISALLETFYVFLDYIKQGTVLNATLLDRKLLHSTSPQCIRSAIQRPFQWSISSIILHVFTIFNIHYQGIGWLYLIIFPDYIYPPHWELCVAYESHENSEETELVVVFQLFQPSTSVHINLGLLKRYKEE